MLRQEHWDLKGISPVEAGGEYKLELLYQLFTFGEINARSKDIIIALVNIVIGMIIIIRSRYFSEKVTYLWSFIYRIQTNRTKVEWGLIAAGIGFILIGISELKL